MNNPQNVNPQIDNPNLANIQSNLPSNMASHPEIIYELYIQAKNQISEDLLIWLDTVHIKNILSMEGFRAAKLYTLINDDAKSTTKKYTFYSIQFLVDSIESLNRYLSNYSEKFRSNAIAKYGTKMTEERRILSFQKLYTLDYNYNPNTNIVSDVTNQQYNVSTYEQSEVPKNKKGIFGDIKSFFGFGDKRENIYINETNIGNLEPHPILAENQNINNPNLIINRNLINENINNPNVISDQNAFVGTSDITNQNLEVNKLENDFNDKNIISNKQAVIIPESDRLNEFTNTSNIANKDANLGTFSNNPITDFNTDYTNKDVTYDTNYERKHLKDYEKDKDYVLKKESLERNKNKDIANVDIYAENYDTSKLHDVDYDKNRNKKQDVIITQTTEIKDLDNNNKRYENKDVFVGTLSKENLENELNYAKRNITLDKDYIGSHKIEEKENIDLNYQNRNITHNKDFLEDYNYGSKNKKTNQEPNVSNAYNSNLNDDIK